MSDEQEEQFQLKESQINGKLFITIIHFKYLKKKKDN